jgi:hypothetical protein
MTSSELGRIKQNLTFLLQIEVRVLVIVYLSILPLFKLIQELP